MALNQKSGREVGDSFCHRDLKPENILMDQNDSPILVDLGFAKYFNKNGDRESDNRCGTPLFVAPEIPCFSPE